jgi:predicted DNA-binding protein YlxM (UPF0122 family)
MSSKIFLGKSGKLNRKQVKGAIELYEKDKFSVSKIAKVYGVNRTLMERVLAGNNVLSIGHKSIIDEKMIQEAGILYNLGKLSLEEVGKSLSVSRWTVKKALHLGSVKTRIESNKGIHRKGKGINKKKRRYFSVLDYDQKHAIFNDYLIGMSGTQIAEKYKVSQAKVYFILNDCGVVMKQCGRYKKVDK